jgi:hypothetical protein
VRQGRLCRSYPFRSGGRGCSCRLVQGPERRTRSEEIGRSWQAGVRIWVSEEFILVCGSACARAAYLFTLVLQLVLGLRPGRRHMRLFSNAVRPGVCRCAVASNPFLHVAGISWSLGRSLVAGGGGDSQGVRGAEGPKVKKGRFIVQGIQS